MGKQHSKRLPLPKTWPVQKKVSTFITRLMPGPHNKVMSMPLAVILKLNFDVKTTWEAKQVLMSKNILVNGVRRVDHRFPVGLFDVLSFEGKGIYRRVVLDGRGRLKLIPIKKDEANVVPCKITGKSIIKGGKVQLNFLDGRNILVDKDEYSVGDTLLVAVPDNKIKEPVALGKGAFIFLIGGKHMGETGFVEDLSAKAIMYKDNEGNVYETYRKYAFALGKTKSLISLM